MTGYDIDEILRSYDVQQMGGYWRWERRGKDRISDRIQNGSLER